MIQTHSSALRDLKIEDCPFNNDLSNMERFIRSYGAFNCKYLWLKKADEVLQILGDKYPTEPLNEDELHFIKENAGNKVLVYLCHSYETYPDIFVFGDDNIAFTTDCFTSIA